MADDARAFVVKAISTEVPTYSIPGVYEELRKGRARIGWSNAFRTKSSKAASTARSPWAGVRATASW